MERCIQSVEPETKGEPETNLNLRLTLSYCIHIKVIKSMITMVWTRGSNIITELKHLFVLILTRAVLYIMFHIKVIKFMITMVCPLLVRKLRNKQKGLSKLYHRLITFCYYSDIIASFCLSDLIQFYFYENFKKSMH